MISAPCLPEGLPRFDVDVAFKRMQSGTQERSAFRIRDTDPDHVYFRETVAPHFMDALTEAHGRCL